MKLQRLFLFSIMFIFGSCTLFANNRGPSYPYITGDGFREFSTHVFDETTNFLDPQKVKHGDIIFIKGDIDFLDKFFLQYHPCIENPYVIISHNSDDSAPDKYYDFLNSSKILAWFGQNIEGMPHEKLFKIPIGIANRRWIHGNPKIFSKCAQRRKNTKRPILCYMNFGIHTYPKERGFVYKYFSNFYWCKKSGPKNSEGYLKDLCQSKFTLSPRGNGLDCHRTWEALLMGSIPIVKTSNLDSMFTDLPVLIVHDWEDVTEEFLLTQYKILQKKTYNMKKIYINYWLECIKSKCL